MRKRTERQRRNLFSFSTMLDSSFRVAFSDGRLYEEFLENQVDLPIGNTGGGVKHKRRVQVGTRRVYLRHMSQCRFERNPIHYSRKADRYFRIQKEMVRGKRPRYFYESPRYRWYNAFSDSASFRKMTEYSRTMCEVPSIVLSALPSDGQSITNEIEFSFNSWTSFGESLFFDIFQERVDDEDELDEVVNDHSILWNRHFIHNNKDDRIVISDDDLLSLVNSMFPDISIDQEILFRGGRTDFKKSRSAFSQVTISNFVSPLDILEKGDPLTWLTFTPSGLGLPIGDLGWYEFCSYLLKKRAEKNLDRSFPQILTFLAEMPETVKSFAEILRKAISVAIALRAGNFEKVINLLIGERGSLLRRISKSSVNISLFYKFGLLPLLEDLKAISDLAGNLDKLGFFSPSIRKRTRMDVSSLFDITSGNPGGTVVKELLIDNQKFTLSYSYRIFIENSSVTLQYANELKVINPILFLVERLGLNSILGTAWELVPLSFVIDWFVNIGDVISRLDIPVDGLDILDECLTHSVTTQGKIILSDISLYNDTEEYSFPDSTLDLNAFATVRNLPKLDRISELHKAVIDAYQPGRSFLSIPTAITAAQLILQRKL